MDIKRKLLEFLYDHKDSGLSVDITPIVKEFDDNRIELMKVVINLGGADGLISPISNAYTIANKDANEYTLYNQTYCKTKITPQGEKYVQENYLRNVLNNDTYQSADTNPSPKEAITIPASSNDWFEKPINKYIVFPILVGLFLVFVGALIGLYLHNN